MNTQVSALGGAAGTVAAGARVPCLWCSVAVATALLPGESEPVFADHPLPAPRGRTRCPASGLTPSEVDPPGQPR